jgi:hypothetical protein
MNNITFNKEKAIETILYLTKKIASPDIYALCKMLYLADKCSLSEYGTLIFGDTYSAMSEGATPSKAYDLLKDAKLYEVNGIKVNGNTIIALRNPDLDCLSESDIECLDRIVNRYDNARKEMYDDAHDSAWEYSWNNKKKDKKSIVIPIENIAKLFSDSNDLISYLANSD